MTIQITNRYFFVPMLIVIILFTVHSSFSSTLNSVRQESYIKLTSPEEYSRFSKDQIENNLSTQAVNNIDFDSSDYDLLDYDDYVKPHKILDRSNINLHIYHTHETYITKRLFLLNNLFPQYPPVETIIRLKNFLI